MALLSDANWTDLFGWIEGHSQWARFPIDESKSLRPNQELRVWLHRLPPVVEDTTRSSAHDAEAPSSIADGQGQNSSPTTRDVVERQFRCLNHEEMAKLQETRKTSLWPRMDWCPPSWIGPSCSTIANNLEAAVGCLSTGMAPVDDAEMLSLPDYLVRDTWSSFKVPVNVLLGDEYRGDAIMYGVGTPALNLFNPEDREDRGTTWRIQHWLANNYMVYRDGFDMGAVIKIHRSGDHTWHRDTIEVAELQALIILLDRQTIYAPKKRKLRAWLVSVNTERFRVLEAYLDQDADAHSFHFSILDERAWPLEDQYPKNDIHGDDETWKWLLSWVLPQPLT
ncbi:hypothetical protein PG985_011302 [Apiospora marii]|uniref:Uncharacterized protein n=1 Tax=Apiospora marii TaxID=335849 RepID=A0ABR1STC0_9PEZI